MSRQSNEWAWNQRGLPPQAKLVLVAMADYCGAKEDGSYYYYGGHARLVEDTGLGDRSLRRYIQALIELGLLERTQEAVNGGKARYRLVGVEEVTGDRQGPGGQEVTGDRLEEPAEEVTGDLQGSGGHGRPPQEVTGDRLRRSQVTAYKEPNLKPNDEPKATPPAASLTPMDELVAIFGKPDDAAGGGWAVYQSIVNRAREKPPGEITRRAEVHAASFNFALTPGSLKKRWTELGGKVAELNVLPLKERQEKLRRAQRRRWAAEMDAQDGGAIHDNQLGPGSRTRELHQGRVAEPPALESGVSVGGQDGPADRNAGG